MPYNCDKRGETGIDNFFLDVDEKKQKKEYPKDSVIYFLTKNNNQYLVDYGLVYDCRNDYILVEILEPRDRRMVNGIPYKKFPAYTEWRKLPENFDWAHQIGSVCELTLDDKTDDDENIDVTDPESILNAYENGALVKALNVDHSHLHIAIDSRFGYRLYKSYVCVTDDDEGQSGMLRATNTYIDYRLCFRTYYDALQRITDYYEAVKNQMCMSEHEWNVSMVRHDVDLWAGYNHVSEEDRQKAMDCLLSDPGFDELETRLLNTTLQYRNYMDDEWIDYGIEPAEKPEKQAETEIKLPFDSWVPEPQYMRKKGESW